MLGDNLSSFDVEAANNAIDLNATEERAEERDGCTGIGLLAYLDSKNVVDQLDVTNKSGEWACGLTKFDDSRAFAPVPDHQSLIVPSRDEVLAVHGKGSDALWGPRTPNQARPGS